MATKKTFEEKIVKEKLAVFTFNLAMQEPEMMLYEKPNLICYPNTQIKHNPYKMFEFLHLYSQAN